MKAGKSRRLPIWYVLAPLATMLLVLPPILELPPLVVPNNLNALQILMVIPFYLGVASIPGYLYAWNGNCDRKELSGTRRIWIDASLLFAVLAAVGGLISIFTVIVFPFDCAALAAALLLGSRYLGKNIREQKRA